MNYRLLIDNIAKKISASMLILVYLVLVLIICGLILKSLPLLTQHNIFQVLGGQNWAPLKGSFGFLSFLLGTLWVTTISLLIAVPLCIATSLYLTEYASVKIQKTVLPLVNVLAAIPPVLYGVWGVLFIIPFIGEYLAPFFGIQSSGYSVFAGGVVLAVMIFPILVSIVVEVLKTIPQELRHVSLSLGATQWETIKHVIIKKARPGIIAAIVLATSRAFGETVAVLMVCGNIPQIPQSVFDAGYPIPALIANNFGEMMSIPLYDSALMFAAFLLFTIIFSFNLFSRIILNKIESKH